MGECNQIPASDAFLEELRRWAREYGWSGDYVEVVRFVEYLHTESGVAVPPEFYAELPER